MCVLERDALAGTRGQLIPVVPVGHLANRLEHTDGPGPAAALRAAAAAWRAQLAERCGAHSYLIDGAEDIQPGWLDDCRAVGITAGASAPDVLVRAVIDRLQQLGAQPPQEMSGQEENVRFSLPKALRV